MEKSAMETMMEQLAAENPKLKMMMDLMQQQRVENESEDKTDRRQLLVSLKKEKLKRIKLLKEMNGLLEQLQDMEAFQEDLAAALGACPACWGEDQDCEICNGKGRPGAFRPDKPLFMELIFPIVQQTPWIRQLLSNQN